MKLSFSLTSLRTFEAVARLRSMSKAADELAVTQGAVSRSIQVLEEDLGAVLFKRTRPFLTRTDAGDALYAEVKLGFERLENGVRRVQALQESGRLAIDVLPTFAIRFLIPRLSRLRALLPALDVDLTVSEKTIDFDIDPVDISIRYGLDLQWPDKGRVRLMQEELVLVCAPGLLASYGNDFSPRMIDPKLLLRHMTRSGAWEDWFAAAQLEPVEPAGLGLEHFIMVIEAAVSELGFALLPRFMIQSELSAGTLVIASMPILRRPQGYYVLFAPERRFDTRIAAFVRWLRSEVHQHDIAATTPS